MKNSILKNLLRPTTEDENETQVSQEITEKMESTKSLQPNFANTTFNNGKRFDSRNPIFTNTGKNAKLAEPKTLEDAQVITSALEYGVTIVLFLDSVTDEAMSGRILDFIDGFCHAYNIIPQPTKHPKIWLYDPTNKKKF